MLVQRVLVPGGGPESWTVLDDTGEVIGPVERYLAYLSAIERSPNTVRAYAISLKLWFEFLAGGRLGLGPGGHRGRGPVRGLAAGPGAERGGAGGRGRPRGGRSSVNRYLAGVFGFYDHHSRTGLTVAAELVAWRRVSRGSYKPFLHHVTKGKPVPVRPVKLPVRRRRPATLEPEQIVAILAACEHLRDRFLFSLLAETGMRIGQALGLRHSDFVSRPREVHIVPRGDNANGARAKSRTVSVVPVSTPLVRLYSEYMHIEYGEIDSDYVFVNLFGGRVGRPLTYASGARADRPDSRPDRGRVHRPHVAPLARHRHGPPRCPDRRGGQAADAPFIGHH